jgi:hypothetical protein
VPREGLLNLKICGANGLGVPQLVGTSYLALNPEFRAFIKEFAISFIEKSDVLVRLFCGFEQSQPVVCHFCKEVPVFQELDMCLPNL